MSDLVERFAALFSGRTDAYGLDAGGCQRVTDRSLFDPTATENVWERHLNGTHPIGIYPLVPFDGKLVGHPENPIDWRVKWGCVDLDVKAPGKSRFDYETTDEAFVAARNLVTALRVLEITGWIERTRSGGFHVWVFAEQWVPASDMRRSLLYACQLADVPPSEVNPKSEGSDDPAFLGNYVRAPFPGATNRLACGFTRTPSAELSRVMLDTNDGLGWYDLGDWLPEAEQTLTTPHVFAVVAALYQPPRSVPHIRDGLDVELDEPLRRRLSSLTYTIFRDGPLDGGDRSSALFKLACCCKKDGLTVDEALAVVSDADDRWGKFSGRRDADRYLIQTVQRAYGSARA